MIKLRKIVKWMILTLIGLLLLTLIAIRFLDLSFRSDDEKLAHKFTDKHQYFPDYIRDDTNQLSYLLGGDKKSTKAILFVHGSPGSADNYSEYFKQDRLQQYKLISVDRLGFGWSKFGQAELSLDAHAAHVQQIAQKESVEQAIIVGHSYGCPVAIKAAINYPMLVAGSVIIAAPMSAKLEPIKWYQKLFNTRPFKWIVPPALDACNLEILGLKSELVQMEEKLDQIETPVVVVQGSKDNLVSMENAAFVKNKLTRSDVAIDMISDGDHFILWSEIPRIENYILELAKENFQD